MDWIFEHLNIVIIIAVVIASMFKSHFDAKTKEANEREVILEDDSETPLDQDKSYRKMPPPVVRTQLPAPRSSEPPPFLGDPGAAADAAEEAAKILKHQRDLAAHLQQIRDTRATTSGGAAVTRARIASTKKGAAKTAADSPSSIRSRLKSPAEIRRAFVLKEILDPPVGLR